MARKVDDDGKRLPIKVCEKHGEYIADSHDSPCPSCEDGE